MINVVVTLEPVPGRTNDVVRELRVLLPLARAEPGCIEYDAAEDVDLALPGQPAARLGVVTVIQKWRTLEDLRAHFSAAHAVTYRSRVSGFIQCSTFRVFDAL